MNNLLLSVFDRQNHMKTIMSWSMLRLDPWTQLEPCGSVRAGMGTMAGIRRPEPEGGLILACSIFPTLTH